MSSGLTIAQLSDLHCGSPHFVPSLLDRAIVEVNEMEPDVVVISGDLTGDGTHALYMSTAPRLVSVATDGSGERSLPFDFSSINVGMSEAHAILTVNSRQLGTTTVTDLVHVDFSKSGSGDAPATKTIAESVGSGEYRFGITSKKSLVYALVPPPKSGQAGLYRLDLP